MINKKRLSESNKILAEAPAAIEAAECAFNQAKARRIESEKALKLFNPIDQAIINIVRREAKNEDMDVEEFLGRLLAAYRLRGN